MQFVDNALARRLESCEEMPQVMYARIFKDTRPEIGAAEEVATRRLLAVIGRYERL